MINKFLSSNNTNPKNIYITNYYQKSGNNLKLSK